MIDDAQLAGGLWLVDEGGIAKELALAAGAIGGEALGDVVALVVDESCGYVRFFNAPPELSLCHAVIGAEGDGALAEHGVIHACDFLLGGVIRGAIGEEELAQLAGEGAADDDLDAHLAVRIHRAIRTETLGDGGKLGAQLVLGGREGGFGVHGRFSHAGQLSAPGR